MQSDLAVHMQVLVGRVSWVEGLVSEHMQVLITMVYHNKGTFLCSLTNRSTQVQLQVHVLYIHMYVPT